MFKFTIVHYQHQKLLKTLQQLEGGTEYKMGCHSGLRVKNATELKKVHAAGGDRTVMIHPAGVNNTSNRFLVYCDITTDATTGWHLVFNAFPRVSSPYVNDAVSTSNRTINSEVPLPGDTVQKKLSDTDIKIILNNGIKNTRTQWYQTSVEFGTVWATGSLTDRSTQYNEFEFPDNWSSNAASPGQRFKRRWGDGTWTDWITSASGGCSGAVGGWSNYYEQSCTQSWFAGCEGGPAINHRCAGAIEDRAERLTIWAA
jgi:hypothetical protein